MPKTPIKNCRAVIHTNIYRQPEVWVIYICLLRPEEVSYEEDTKCSQWFSYFATKTHIPMPIHKSSIAVNKPFYSGWYHSAAEFWHLIGQKVLVHFP